ncbi:hypothetical protein HPP92_017149 [Vanilla planifolia]|uniref:Ionotropic glutamate receptor C-terminal domain-containing protein n=1 Tax=Vanilla planifolia TaxID=51239 RepID=A0A835QDJ1_VANPL|nr:hypothetical protein HPP92_017149 [Vanilla planifolia]
MAVDDFYAAHPEYSTRLALHIRDSSGDAFGAAAAEWDARFNNLTVEGYSIDIFKAVMRELPYAPYEFVLYGDRNGSSNGTYNDLLYQIYLQNFDGVVGDVTILANRSLYADFTLPYTDSGVSMLVPLKNKNKKSSWTFLVLLDTNLWLAIGAFFIFTGFVVWLLEHKINGEFQGSPKDQLATVLFFTLSSLVFAHREKLLSNLSRIVMIAWVFVVFVLQSIYIAKLSSMLTIEQLQPTVRGLDDLIKQGYYVGYMNDSFMPTLLKRWEFNESKLIAFNSPQDYHEALSNGTLAVFLDETPYLKIFLNEHCGKYTMVGPIYKTAGFGFAFSKGSPLVREVSKGILKLQESNEMLKIDEKLRIDYESTMVSVKGRGEMGMLEGEVKIVGELLEHEFRLKAQQIFARASSSIAPVQSAMTAQYLNLMSTIKNGCKNNKMKNNNISHITSSRFDPSIPPTIQEQENA